MAKRKSASANPDKGASTLTGLGFKKANYFWEAHKKLHCFGKKILVMVGYHDDGVRDDQLSGLKSLLASRVDLRAVVERTMLAYCQEQLEWEKEAAEHEGEGSERVKPWKLTPKQLWKATTLETVVFQHMGQRKNRLPGFYLEVWGDWDEEHPVEIGFQRGRNGRWRVTGAEMG